MAPGYVIMHLQCSHLQFYYPGTDKLVLNDLCLEFSEPGFHAFFGPSGVGKTSLARVITGESQSAAGRIHLDGIRKLLYAYNLERLPDWSNVGRHLERITPAHKMRQKEELVEAFGLSAIMKQRFSQLSLGQQNRTNLVRYLVQDFELLIMDESLANVDEKTRGMILVTIKKMFPQSVFIYISHNVMEVAKFCRQIWVLRSAHKAPQAVAVRGQDFRQDGELDQQALQHTMLEMMRVA